MSSKLLPVIVAMILSGCVSLRSVSLTPIPSKKTKKVSSETSRFIFFHFNFNNDYVDEMVNSLKKKCRNGIIKGILTKDELIMYFPLILHKRRVTASGYCLKNKS